jgi:predicted nucleic acid-binding protein
VALLAETHAGLAAAYRARRIDDDELRSAVGGLDALWREIDGLDVTERLARRAGELAQQWALRGYDAIHLASAEAILDDGDVMVVSDIRLAEAATSIGIEALIPGSG